ncbi:MAG: DNA translocase FtsK 4TM domain-containing protein, partial [Anaerolineales bacterium]|nr:DNA translocase FtsK 4TM domain-containing protein [Anaerolineales bacterium]
MAKDIKHPRKTSSSSRRTSPAARSGSQPSTRSPARRPSQSSTRKAPVRRVKAVPGTPLDSFLRLRGQLRQAFGRPDRSAPLPAARRAPASSSARSHTPQAPSRRAAAQPAPPARPPMSLDARLDLLGVILLFLGLALLLVLLSASNSGAAGGVLAFLRRFLGWGAYVFPLGLLGIGLWLVLRSFERVPRIALERLLGLILLYGGGLAFLHWSQHPVDGDAAYLLANAGKGGGYFGAAVYNLLDGLFGVGGSLIALLAWLLISLTLIFDRPLPDLFHWISALWLRLADAWDDLRAPRHPALPRPAGSQPPVSAAAPRANAPARERGVPFIPLTDEEETLPVTWVLPDITEILDPGSEPEFDDEEDRARARLIEETLTSFGAPGKVVEINRGPTITQFGVEPELMDTRNGKVRVRVSKIANLA